MTSGINERLQNMKKKRCYDRKVKLKNIQEKTSRVLAFKNAIKEGPYYFCLV